jgi:uncharacterized delta-60 repeat protein
MSKWMLILLVNIVAFTQIHAQAGALDVTFGNNGIVKPNFPEKTSNSEDLALQPDGKIVTIGTQKNTVGSNLILARFHPNGDLDTTFGVQGMVQLLAAPFSSGLRVKVLNDGKILATGIQQTNDIGNYLLARFNADGSIDPSFGNNGMVSGSIRGVNEIPYTVAIQPDNKIIIAGLSIDTTFQLDAFMLRFLPNGNLDQSFGNQGVVLTFIDDNFSSYILELTLQPDGKIIAAGAAYSGLSGGYNGGLVLRYLPNGQLDASFQNKGAMLFGAGRLASVALQPDGKMVLGGDFIFPPEYGFALSRIQSDGTLDKEFGDLGYTLLDFEAPSDETNIKVLVLPDGKIIGTGTPIVSSNNGYGFHITRLNRNGKLDPDFGTGGKVTTLFDLDGATLNTSAVYQPDGKLLLCGTYRKDTLYDITLARYILDINWQDTIPVDTSKLVESPLRFYPNPTPGQAVLEYHLAADMSVSIALFDVLGRKLQPLHDETLQLSGNYQQPLRFGDELAAGAYLLRLTRGTKEDWFRVVRVRP